MWELYGGILLIENFGGISYHRCGSMRMWLGLKMIEGLRV